MRSPTITYAGIELPGIEEHEIALSAVVMIKVMTREGQVVYREFKSPDLHWMEALGMVTTFADTCRGRLMRGVRGME